MFDHHDYKKIVQVALLYTLYFHFTLIAKIITFVDLRYVDYRNICYNYTIKECGAWFAGKHDQSRWVG